MTHPYEEDREMKDLKDDIDMFGFVADADCGIPTRCPCEGGGESSTRCHGIRSIKPILTLYQGENTSLAKISR